MENCDDPNFIKTGVCHIKKDSGCNNTNILTTSSVQQLKNKSDGCINFKKRIRHKQVCN